MMGGHLLMSEKERQRKVVLEGVLEGRLLLREAAERLGISYRHGRRVMKRYREGGDGGLIHRSRGRASHRRRSLVFRGRVLARYRERYEGFGPTLSSEKLEEDGLKVDHETLRRWLIKEGVWVRCRRSAPYRSWRPRRERFGALVQMDGSHHAWFGEGEGKACLMNLVDDATGLTLSYMDREETTEAALRVLRAWVKRYGIPQALYTDRKNVFVTDREPTLEEQLAGEEPMTAFGRACKKLGIEIITAYSPQAKGRVERSHGVYQDRFVKELALLRIKTIEGANALLTEGFVDGLNRRFAVGSADPADAHLPLPPDLDLDAVFCWEEVRTLQSDFTLRYQNRWYQVLEENAPLPKPKSKITVRITLAGALHLVFEGRRLKYRWLEGRPEKPSPAVEVQPKPMRRASRPSLDHPWRRFPFSPPGAGTADRSKTT